MSKIIDKPFDKFWDGSPTRRELQTVLNKIGTNQTEIMGMCDTAALVLNFILEVKLGIKDRTELDIYVEAKKLQMAERIEKLKAAVAAEEDAKSTAVEA